MDKIAKPPYTILADSTAYDRFTVRPRPDSKAEQLDVLRLFELILEERPLIALVWVNDLANPDALETVGYCTDEVHFLHIILAFWATRKQENPMSLVQGYFIGMTFHLNQYQATPRIDKATTWILNAAGTVLSRPGGIK